MRRYCFKTLFCVCLLLPVTGTADDTFDRLYESRWRLGHSLDTATYLADLSKPASSFEVDVDDGSSILRVTKIRSLSLLTLSGDDRAKWFLGINEDGLVGIHYRGFSKSGVKRHLDLASLFTDKNSKDEKD